MRPDQFTHTIPDQLIAADQLAAATSQFHPTSACIVCNKPISRGPATLWLNTYSTRHASLHPHHTSCPAPDPHPIGAVDYRILPVLLPLATPAGAYQHLPTVLLNPSVDTVGLHLDGSRWAADTLIPALPADRWMPLPELRVAAYPVGSYHPGPDEWVLDASPWGVWNVGGLPLPWLDEAARRKSVWILLSTRLHCDALATATDPFSLLHEAIRADDLRAGRLAAA